LVWRPGAVVGPVARWAEKRLAELCQQAIEVESPSHHVE
jgi:hypothetical protein